MTEGPQAASGAALIDRERGVPPMGQVTGAEVKGKLAKRKEAQKVAKLKSSRRKARKKEARKLEKAKSNTLDFSQAEGGEQANSAPVSGPAHTQTRLGLAFGPRKAASKQILVPEERYNEWVSKGSKHGRECKFFPSPSVRATTSSLWSPCRRLNSNLPSSICTGAKAFSQHRSCWGEV